MSDKDKSKKKSLFSALNNLMFEGSDEAQIEKDDSQESTSSTSSNSVSKFVYSENTNSNPAANIGIPGTGVFDERFYNSLKEVVEKNNIDGFDYYEFAKTKLAMDASMAGMAEAIRFNTAYTAIKANAPTLTKEKLIETAKFYISKLEEEGATFDTEMKAEVSRQVQSRLETVKNTQDAIAKKQEEIIKLQSEITSLQTESANVNAEAQKIQSQIDISAKNFKVTLEMYKNQINGDINSIQQYIVQ